jgi:DNA-binding MarR family transcriptional regulator
MAIQTQTAVLLFIASHPSGVCEIRDGRANELVRTQINYQGGGPGMSKVLADLQTNGLIERIIDGKRTKRIALTKSGFESLEALKMVDSSGKLLVGFTVDGAAPASAEPAAKAPAKKAAAKKAPAKKAPAKKAAAKKAPAKKAAAKKAAAATVVPVETAAVVPAKKAAAKKAPTKKAAAKKAAPAVQAAVKAASTKGQKSAKALMDEFHSNTISSIQELLYGSLKSAISVENQRVAELLQENSELRATLSAQSTAAVALQRELNASLAHAKKLEEEKAASAANTGALIAARDRLNNLFS